MPDFETLTVLLTDAQYDLLEKNYSKSKGSSQIGKRAVEIVKIFLSSSGWVAKKPTRKGIDLEFRRGSEKVEIEVKGTADHDIAWNKLVISGDGSRSNLEDGCPLYRVYKVFERNPMIAILKWRDHFIIKQEPRWKIIKKDSSSS